MKKKGLIKTLNEIDSNIKEVKDQVDKNNRLLQKSQQQIEANNKHLKKR